MFFVVARPPFATLSVFVCMLDYSGPARTRALRNSVLFLGHRFPNVRKTTAEALYLKLLANEDIVDEVRKTALLFVSVCLHRCVQERVSLSRG